METIDVTNADLKYLEGDGYYAEAFKCLNDIHAVLTYDAASEKRIALSKSTDGAGPGHYAITPRAGLGWPRSLTTPRSPATTDRLNVRLSPALSVTSTEAIRSDGRHLEASASTCLQIPHT